MTRQLKQSELRTRNEIVGAPTLPSSRACDDHSFELSTALYLTMAGLLLAFVTVLAASSKVHMVVSYGVIVAFIGMFFAVPAMFVRATPQPQRHRSLAWREFMDKGINTANGHCSGREAAVLVLTLPVLILFFGLVVVAIEQFVS